ncbi:MAG: NAD(P)-binding protein [Nitrospirae bacterium]|nr:NAD(P)-binding protein [Nitrospirota bacterium]NTW64705.1 NAD(P)-binding protein [Nitrospirota bacterium]
MPKYEVAFIGAGISGLYAAALLAKAGKKIIIVDPGEKAGGAAAERLVDRSRFIAGPNIGYGFEPGSPAQVFCAGLGLSPDQFPAALRFQVALPDRRITVSPNVQETLAELRREFPREIDRLSWLYGDANRLAQKASKSALSSYVLGHRSAEAYLRTCRFSRELTAYFDVQSRFFFGQSIRHVPLASLALLLTTPPRTFPGGLGPIADRLLSVLGEHQCDVRLREPWPELIFRRRRISAVRMPHGAIEPRSIVINTSWQPREHTMFISVREEVIPVGMASTVIYLPDYGKPEDTVILTLPHDRSSGAPEGTMPLTVLGTSRERLREHSESIIPFLSDCIVIADEQDHQAREFALPKEVTVSSPDPLSAVKLPVPNSIDNLYLLPDSSRSLHRSLQAGQRVADKLR